MSTPSPLQRNISPSARQNALTFCLLGVLFFAVAMFCWLVEAPLAPAAFGLLWIASAVLLFLGIAKLLEPETSFIITPAEITYSHRRGRWTLPWEAITRFDAPRVHRGLNLEDLPYLGFRLEDIEVLLERISPRLMSHVIVEQRHLLALGLRYERPDLSDYSQYYDIPERFIGRSGREYKGLQAMFAVRSQQLRELLGYDIYIHASALDRPLDEFIQHLRQLQSSRQQHL
ncbi:DUF2982 domain-containing protein [Pseudidiomarina aestuarii]|uniref:DUF2982 domain-containing protein n=1 Tax=Pseudidiomarina aestuarii TaxID=624146 RepID=UPI003A9720D6